MNEYGIKVSIDNPNEVTIMFNDTHQLVSLPIDMIFLKKYLGSQINELDFNGILLIYIVNLNCDYTHISTVNIPISGIIFNQSKIDTLIYDSSSSIQVVDNSHICLLIIKSFNIEVVSIGGTGKILSLQCKDTVINTLHCMGELQRITTMIIHKLYMGSSEIFNFVGYCSKFRGGAKDKIQTSYLNGESLKIGDKLKTYRNLETNVVEYLLTYVI